MLSRTVDSTYHVKERVHESHQKAAERLLCRIVFWYSKRRPDGATFLDELRMLEEL